MKYSAPADGADNIDWFGGMPTKGMFIFQCSFGLIQKNQKIKAVRTLPKTDAPARCWSNSPWSEIF